MAYINWPEVAVTTTISIALVVLTYGVLYSMKPKLRIDSAVKNGDSIRITVINQGRFDAVNVRAEVCAYEHATRLTYHFNVDHADFLIIPEKCSQDNEKVFKAVPTDYPGLIADISEGRCRLRVRLHSYHAFSGLGKAEERIFNKV